MRRIKTLAIQNCSIEGFGLYEKYLKLNGAYLTQIHPYRDNDFPAIDEFDLVIIGGTPLSANATHEYPFLQRETDLLKEALDLDKYCMGICFGAQILARILGASISKCPHMEIGNYEVELTKSGSSDTILDGFPSKFPVFQWHGDTFQIPPQGNLLAEGAECKNQMFRYGGVLGIQFHLETTCKEAAIWAGNYSEELIESGKSLDEILVECGRRENEREILAELLISNLLREI